MMDSNNGKGCFYGIKLKFLLEAQIEQYEQERQSYWEGLGDWSAIEYDKAERFAKAALKSSGQLISIEEVDGDLSELENETNKMNKFWRTCWKRAAYILSLDMPMTQRRERLHELAKESPEDIESEDSPLKLVYERFIIDMSWEATGKIVEGVSRIFQLYDLVLDSTPSKSTQEFLARLSRCYIWGFDPECIMLCRSVVDSAFKENITHEVCEKHIEERNYNDFSLSERIKAAYKEGIIDYVTKKKVEKVRLRGNKAVHEQPNVTQDVWGTICDTVAVLEKITRQN